MKKNLVLILSNINRAVSHEWTAEMLDADKFNISFILLNPNDSEMENYLIQKGIKYLRINLTSKKDIIKSIFLIFRFLIKNKIDIVHTHLFEANIAGLIAAYLARVEKRVYTRHHSTYHHEYFLKAVKYDKLVNYLATDIIAISENVKQVLVRLEKVNPKKIHLVHHGFHFDQFDNVNADRIEYLRNKYKLFTQSPVIGVISRYTEWKGVQFIIPAFKKLLNDFPNALLVLANATGNYSSEIKLLLRKLDSKNFIEIEYEKDFMALYKLFDIFVHVPINDHAEAYGQTYVESLGFGIPSIFTISGIAREFVVDQKNALVVNYENTDEIYFAMKTLIESNFLGKKLAEQGKKDVRQLFSVEKMISGFEKVYLS